MYIYINVSTGCSGSLGLIDLRPPIARLTPWFCWQLHSFVQFYYKIVCSISPELQYCVGWGAYVRKKWPYGAGVVTSTLTTPTQYDHFFWKSSPLPHNMPTFRTKSTLGHDPPPIIFTWPDLNPDNVHFVKFGLKFGSDNAHFDEFSIKCCIDGALFVGFGYPIVPTLLNFVTNPCSIMPTSFNFGPN